MISIPVLTIEEYFPEHLQYIRDTLVEQENTVSDAINELDCTTNKNKLATLYALSRMSGELAARAMKPSKCQTLQSFGATAATRHCRTLNLDFRVDAASRCGPQPRAGKGSISLDGFMLPPYSECLWKGAVVNFRGERMSHETESGRK